MQHALPAITQRQPVPVYRVNGVGVLSVADIADTA
jgi:hypothetical protein